MTRYRAQPGIGVCIYCTASAVTEARLHPGRQVRPVGVPRNRMKKHLDSVHPLRREPSKGLLARIKSVLS